MYGLTTMDLLNQRNAEAERIMRQYAKQDGRTMPLPEAQPEQEKQEQAAD